MTALTRVNVGIAVLGAMLSMVPSRAFAQAQEPADFTEWVMNRLSTAVAAAAGTPADDKQVDAPSAAAGSSALVDTSGAPDILGLATQLVKFGTSSASEPMSLTLTGFGLKTALSGQDPARPTVYAAGRDWRRVSVTLARQTQDDDGNADPAQIIGAKVLLYDRRDPTNPTTLRSIQTELNRGTVNESIKAARVYEQLNELLFQLLKEKVTATSTLEFVTSELGQATFKATLAKLTANDLERIDDLLKSQMAPVMAALAQEQENVVKAIRQAPQFAVAYQSKLREGAGKADEYHWVAIGNYGVASRFSVAGNAAFVKTTTDTLSVNDWKGSVEATLQLTPGASTFADLAKNKRPLTLTGSFSATRHTGKPNTRKGQVKLTVPIALGMSLPVSVTVANNPELIDEDDVRGHVGFTIDFSALQRTLRSAVR